MSEKRGRVCFCVCVFVFKLVVSERVVICMCSALVRVWRVCVFKHTQPSKFNFWIGEMWSKGSRKKLEEGKSCHKRNEKMTPCT